MGYNIIACHEERATFLWRSNDERNNGLHRARCPPAQSGGGGQLGAWRVEVPRNTAPATERPHTNLSWLTTMWLTLLMLLPAILPAQNEATLGKWDRFYFKRGNYYNQFDCELDYNIFYHSYSLNHVENQNARWFDKNWLSSNVKIDNSLFLMPYRYKFTERLHFNDNNLGDLSGLFDFDCKSFWFIPCTSSDFLLFSAQRDYGMERLPFTGQLCFQFNDGGWGQCVSLHVNYGVSSLSGYSRPQEVEIYFLIFSIGKIRINR